jgi:hypothetical protein
MVPAASALGGGGASFHALKSSGVGFSAVVDRQSNLTWALREKL